MGFISPTGSRGEPLVFKGNKCPTGHAISGEFLELFFGTAGFLPCNTEVADTLLYRFVNRVQACARELFFTTIWEHTHTQRYNPASLAGAPILAHV